MKEREFVRFRITVYEDREPIFGKTFVLEKGKVRAIDCDKDGHISLLLELEPKGAE